MIYRRILAFAVVAATCFAQHAGRKASDIPIQTSDGKTIHLGQYKGKVCMIEMMLTTCPECLQTMQFLGRLQAEYGPRGFQAIGIALDPDASAVKPFAERYRFPFPVGHLDKAPAIKFMDLNATAQPVVPYIIFVDWIGNVRFQYPANDPIFTAGEKNIRAVADGLLRQAAEKKGPQFETRPAGKQ